MLKKINFYQLTITVIAVLFASVVVVYGWTAPVGVPPNNDVPPPINTGADGQIKQGGLSVGSALGATSTGFSVLNGNSAFGTTTIKNKGMGTFGFLNTQDVWLRDANSGAGAWASDTTGCTCVGSNLSLNTGTSPCWTSYSGGNSNYPHCGQICTPAGWRSLAPCGNYY